jgi:ribosomal protein S18 acetylase RimI-like enzyme
MKHVVDFSPTEYDVLRIRKKLQNYNSRFSEIREKPVFVISEFDKNDELIGGIACTIAGQWLEIDYLWVKDGHRGNGLGKKLLFEAEKIGMEKGCKK